MIASRTAVLGIDIGGVVTKIPIGSNRDDSFLGKDPLLTPKMEDSFTVISELAKQYRIVFITRAGGPTRRALADWFRDQQFFESTELSMGRVFYTSTRDEKIGVAMDQGVTHFIDDRLEVLMGMLGIVPNLIAFQARPSDKERYSFTSQKVLHADSWNEVRRLLLPEQVS